MNLKTWPKPDDENSLGKFILKERNKTLKAYEAQPNLIVEHANQEHDASSGGYAHRQLFELVQNSADSLVSEMDGTIVIRMTETHLYCADNGKPIDCAGLRALMFSHLSPKRKTEEIGRFGLGFKSVLKVSDSPEFFSKSGSFRFDRQFARDTIKDIEPNTEHYPVLRVPDAIDPEKYSGNWNLCELSQWASNIVRLPLLPNALQSLRKQFESFPKEFLLFVKHVDVLQLEDSSSDYERKYEIQDIDDSLWLVDSPNSKAITEWKLYERMHELSAEAVGDRRGLDNEGIVKVQWAVPVNRLNEPGKFWAFFPTESSSLVAGILNAPWKTNEDRQNLLPGPYNDELIKSAALLISENLHQLQKDDDPARHLDAFPRRSESGDADQVSLLRNEIFSNACKTNIVPDQAGSLCLLDEVHYQPEMVTQDGDIYSNCLDKWSEYKDRPLNWLHNKAITRNRISVIDRLHASKFRYTSRRAPRARISEWLESLTNSATSGNQAEASMTAIQVAALVSAKVQHEVYFGKIVRTMNERLEILDPSKVFLPSEDGYLEPLHSSQSFVDSLLVSDEETLKSLKKIGISTLSSESLMEAVISRLHLCEPDPIILKEFWAISRKLSPDQVLSIIDSMIKKNNFIEEERDSFLSRKILIFTFAEEWKPRYEVLLPDGIIVGNGSRDNLCTVNVDFHKNDLDLLNRLAVTNTPVEDYRASTEQWFNNYQTEHRRKFKKRKLKKTPQEIHLQFKSTFCSGPLQVLKLLSVEGRAAYTDALLSLDSTFDNWIMHHDTQTTYPDLQCESPAIRFVRNFGRINTPQGVVKFSDVLGKPPKNSFALGYLLKHPKASKIKQAFGLMEPTPDLIGEEEAIPFIDVWPGLSKIIPEKINSIQLIRCEYISVSGVQMECLLHESNFYILRFENEQRELELVIQSLELELSESDVSEILQFKTEDEIEQNRSKVRLSTTDAERLLASVGVTSLKDELPPALIEVFKSYGEALDDIQWANAAISTYHTDALKQFKNHLTELAPPANWNGSPRAIEFVRSLGFSAEWAGERNKKRDPYVEVSGPSRLPKLHEFQETIVKNVKDMLMGSDDDRRGMISLPTGSGKTRVAVQSIVEAIRDGIYSGGVLWIADRDEICEQAVEAWQKVWSSVGLEGSHLRISRLWAGQSRPQPLEHFHIVVATRQTLHSRLTNRSDMETYDFLKNFMLVVFDEAHRSISGTVTEIMKKIGLSRNQKEDEPFLIGLTATPYKGHDEVETTRLVKRYGGNRLDRGAFASECPIAIVKELQSMQVLAKADHKTIKGETVTAQELLKEQQSIFDTDRESNYQLPWLPQSVENRIAASVERTKRIISAFEKYIESEWPSLIFATSVEHSKTIAALLNLRGISARSVSGYTMPSTRRKIVEEFREGRIQTIVNYGVFTEGFDAPKTRAIIVARPVYSPNLYFQMIGRGLRGAKNGGNDRCLILNVEDNVESFQQDLAFSELNWLWAR